MQKVECFKASDGTLFESESECEVYEESLQLGPMIEAFRTSDMCPYDSPRHQSMMTKLIPAWEEFKRQNPLKETADE